MPDAADVSDLVQMFEASEDATREARQRSERDRDYYDGKQLTSTEVETLKARGQPPVVYNRIQRKVDFLSGLERQQRKDPKAFPRTPKDEGAAHAATDAIRYACDNANWDEIRSAAFDDLQVEGTCAVLVGHVQTKEGFDPDIKHIRWDRFFHDPHSSRPDFDDASYMGIVTWYDYDVAARRWNERKEILTETLMADNGQETYDDKPKDKMWSDQKRKRVRVVEMYYKRENQWYRCVFTKSGHLEDPQPSPYLDENHEPENPIKASTLYVDRDNNRYGGVRMLIDPQDEINKRRSKSLFRSSMRQARVSPVSMQDAEKIRKELARPDGLIVGEKDDFEILQGNDLLQAEFLLLQEAKNEIDLLGANAALAGKNENDMSGRAILAQQQGGMVEVARMFDRLRMLSLEVYRSTWNRIRQMWTAEKWIRVTDDERNMKFVGLNQQVTLAQLAQEVVSGDEHALEVASTIVPPQVLQAALQGDPEAQAMLSQFVQANAQAVVETRNAVNELDVDIVVDESMDTPTVQAEQFDALVKIIPGIVNLPPAYAKMLIRASAFRDKDQMLEELEQSQQADPMMEQMKQVQMAGAVAEVEKTESETVKNYAQAEAADPSAQQQIEYAKAEHQAGLAEQKQQHGMMLAERGQAMKEKMAARQPQKEAA